MTERGVMGKTSAYENRKCLFPMSWVFHTESQKWLVEILGSLWFLPKIFQFWLFLSYGQSKDHLSPIHNSSPEPISHWYSQNIYWVNEWRNECMNSLDIYGVISSDNILNEKYEKHTKHFVGIDNMLPSLSL